MQTVSAAQASRMLGISLDTLRRWDREGKIEVRRDDANRRVVPLAEVDRLRAAEGSVEIDGLLARVEIDVTEPSRVVAIITRESAEELGLKPGMSAAGVVKSTSVMVER
jgi:molybdopterin-binding protein